MVKCSQWHDLIVLNIQWYGVICFLRYAWWCSHILSDKYSTVQGMLVWWYVCCKVMIHSYILWWQWYDATWYDACFGVMTHFYALWCVHITWWWWVHILDDIDMMMHTLHDTCLDLIWWCTLSLIHVLTWYDDAHSPWHVLWYDAMMLYYTLSYTYMPWYSSMHYDDACLVFSISRAELLVQ